LERNVISHIAAINLQPGLLDHSFSLRPSLAQAALDQKTTQRRAALFHFVHDGLAEILQELTLRHVAESCPVQLKESFGRALHESRRLRTMDHLYDRLSKEFLAKAQLGLLVVLF
jgi:hypothetical protein